jgi:pre-mRNA-splicing factor ATP-dependent RNA helicase DHX38/PRP16
MNNFLVIHTASNCGIIKQVRRDGTKMSLAQSKKLSQLSADNAQWEDRQLMRSGTVRGTEVQTEFDDEEEHKVILLVHGK